MNLLKNLSLKSCALVKITISSGFMYNRKINKNHFITYKYNLIINIIKKEYMILKQRLDLLYGLQQEDKVLPIIQEVFNDSNISKTKSAYCKYDFIGEKFMYELKSLNVTITTHKTTVIGVNKIFNSKNEPHISNLVLLFQYKQNNINNENDLYYIRFNKELFLTFNRRQIILQRDGSLNEIIDIPHGYLTKINIDSKITLEIPSIDYIEIIKKYKFLDDLKLLN